MQQVVLGLGVLCGVLLVVVIAQALGLGRGYRVLPDSPQPLDPELLEPPLTSEHALPLEAHYAEIEQRPLFNGDRRPRPVVTPDQAKQANQNQPPPMPLNASLAGIIVTAEEKLALVRDNTTQTVMRLREGMPLKGDLGGWRVISIEPRRVVFDGGPAQGQAELKLEPGKSGSTVATPLPVGARDPFTAPFAGGSAPPPPPPGTPGHPDTPIQPTAPPTQMPATPAAAARQDEIERIIEERRKQMRAEAERMAREQGQQ